MNTEILPIGTGNSGLGSDAMGAALGGGFGGLIGSWFGNGWGGGFGNRGAGAVDAAATGFSTSILNDGINAVQNSINGMNMNLSSGLCNIGYQTLDQSSRNQLAMMQGFATLGHDNCQNTNSVVSAVTNVGTQMQNCCCQTQRLIEQQGCQTRELIQNQYTRELETQLCDAKSKISTLESNAFATALVDQKISSATANIIGHMAVLLNRGTTTASSSPAAA